MDLQLRDHVVIITGGTSGIGAATALALASEGACPVQVSVLAPTSGLVRPKLVVVVSAIFYLN